MAAQPGDQCVQHVHRVELRLVGQHRRAVRRERGVDLVLPGHVQAEPGRGLVLAADGRDLARVGGVGERGPALHRDPGLRAEAEQPLHGLAVAVDVRAPDPLRLVPQDPGQAGALQQRQLRRRVARRHRPDRARLDDRDPPAGAGQQQRGRESGDPGTDDEVVERLVGVQRVVGYGVGAGQPQGGHAVSSVGDPARTQGGPGHARPACGRALRDGSLLASSGIRCLLRNPLSRPLRLQRGPGVTRQVGVHAHGGSPRRASSGTWARSGGEHQARSGHFGARRRVRLAPSGWGCARPVGRIRLAPSGLLVPASSRHADLRRTTNHSPQRGEAPGSLGVKGDRDGNSDAGAVAGSSARRQRGTRR